MAIHVLLVILIVHYVTGKIEEELLQLLVVQLSDVSEESSDKQSTINNQPTNGQDFILFPLCVSFRSGDSQRDWGGYGAKGNAEL